MRGVSGQQHPVGRDQSRAATLSAFLEEAPGLGHLVRDRARRRAGLAKIAARGAANPEGPDLRLWRYLTHGDAEV
jgi:hypothetical protein